MLETNPTIEEKRNQFNQAFSAGNQDELLKAFNALETHALETLDYAFLGTLYALLTGFLHVHLQMDLLIKYVVRFLDYANTYSALLDYEDYYALAALLEYELGNYESSKAYVLKEIEIHERNGNKRGIASRLGNIAEIEIITGHFNDAINTALDAKSILSELGLSNEVHGYTIKTVLAKCYIELDDYERALSYMTELLNWPELDMQPHVKVELYTSFARYHDKLSHDEEAIMYFQEAIDLSIEDGYLTPLQDLHLQLSKTYKKYNQIDKSHVHMEEYLRFAESWKKRNLSVLKQNAELEMQLLAREKELVQLKQHGRNLRLSGDFDRLTATYSRSYGLDHINRLIEKSKLANSDFCLLLIEMPCLKELGKKEGLELTENILIEFADTLIRISSTNHQIIRYDLYKFIVIFEDESLEVALENAKRYINILKSISFDLNNQLKTLALNCGILDNHKHDIDSAESMIRLASLGVYQSEKVGKNQITIW